MPFENWEEDNGLIATLKRNPKKFLVIFLVGILACASIGYGLMRIWSPDSDPVTVADAPELSKPVLNATSLYIGETLQIAVTLNTGAEGVQVFFYENDTVLGSDYTDDTGTALYNRMVSQADTYVYKASAEV